VLARFSSRGGPQIEARIREVLAELRPMLRIEPASLELVRFEDERGLAVLQLQGDCPDCSMSVVMMMEGISAHLRARVPEVREVTRADDSTRNG
jgi:Fe-S cluster biogenesis protein NfuA